MAKKSKQNKISDEEFDRLKREEYESVKNHDIKYLKKQKSEREVRDLSQMVQFTVITKTVKGKESSSLTKKFTIGKDKELVKDGTACFVQTAEIETKNIQFGDLGELLKGLAKNEALIHGISHHAPTRIVSKRYKKQFKDLDAITRTKNNFMYPDNGLLSFDYDVPPGEKPLTKIELLQALRKLHPELEKAALLWRPSTSSCITSTGSNSKVYSGITNQRVYMPYINGENIMEFAQNLERLAWENGYGYIFVSAAGTALPRCLFDMATFSPERLDFAAGADCGEGLRQVLPEPYYEKGMAVDLDNIGEIVSAKRWKAKVESEKIKRSRDIAKARRIYLNKQIDNLAESANMTTGKAKKVIASRMQMKLMPDDIVYTDDMKQIRIHDIMDNPTKYHGMVVRDPLEPEYGSSKAKIFAEDDQVTINSFAHGGRVFRAVLNIEYYIRWLREFNEEDLLEMWTERMDEFEGTEVEKDKIYDYIKGRTGVSKNSLQKDLKSVSEIDEFIDSKKKDLTHHQIAEQLIANLPSNSITTEGALFYYNGEDRWQRKSVDDLEVDVAKAYDTMPKCSRRSDYVSISKHVYTILHEPDFFSEVPVGIATPDYFWELGPKGPKKKAHKPAHRVRFLIPYNMGKEGVKPKAFLKFLHWAFPFDKKQIDLLQEIMGAIFYGVLNFSYQKAVLFRGSGQNGKGVLMELLRSMIPAAYVSEVEPHLFHNPLYVAELSNKLLNVVGELDKFKEINSTSIKKVIDSSQLMGKPIYEKPFTFPSMASHIFSSNHPMVMRDDSFGMRRRWLYLSFTNTITEEERIPHMGKLLSELEGPEILRWATEGLIRLRATKEFTRTVSSEKIRNENFQNADPIRSFFLDNDFVQEEVGGRIPRNALYKHFSAWYAFAGFVDRIRPTKNDFNQYAIEELNIEVKKIRGVLNFVGYSLKALNI